MGITFPKAFEERMKELLGQEYSDFLEAFEKPFLRSARLNPLKTTSIPEDLVPWIERKSPFCEQAYLLKEGVLPSQLASYKAGLFYMQEASASSVVPQMGIQPGDYVLDLCAAPGSKSTQIGEYLKQEGLLVANEFVAKRAPILLENVQRHGLQNAIVLQGDTKWIAKELESCFDRVLVDAPCSGEGLFLKDEQAKDQWSLENVSLCAKRQKEILENAYRCLRKGGYLMYSTCTFSREENEDQIVEFLRNHEDMEIVELDLPFGRRGFEPLPQTRRIFPMDGGSGHFMAFLKKAGQEKRREFPKVVLKKEHPFKKEVNALLEEPYRYFFEFQSKLMASNIGFLDSKNLKIMRQMVYVGEMKQDRLVLDHAFFMASKFKEERVIDVNEKEWEKVLHGETLRLSYPKGYYALRYQGAIFAGVRSDGQQLKNLYPKVLRLR